MSGNLMLEATPKFQVFGFQWDYYVNNYIVGEGSQTTICGPTNIGSMAGNTFVTITSTSRSRGAGDVDPEEEDGDAGDGGCWPAKQTSMTVAQVEAVGKGLIGLPSA
jgi:hypothetical protein